MIKKMTLVAALLLAGCGTDHPFDRGSEFDDGTGGTITGPISFSTHVVPALQACAGCHSGGTGGWAYAGGAGAFDAVSEKIDKGSPPNSELLVKATGGGGHGGGTLFTVGSSEYQAILAWIEQGGLDN